MFKNFQKVLAVVMTLAFVLVYYTPAEAGLLSTAKVTLSEPRAATNSSYKFNAVARTGGTYKGIKMSWKTTASSGSAFPTSGSWGDAALSAEAANLVGLTAGWTIDKTDAASGILYLVKAAGDNLASTTAMSWQIDTIGNAAIAASPGGCPANPTNASAGTCFVRVQMYDTETLATMQAETAGNIIDYATVAYTINAGVNVTAKVDPALTFTVVGVEIGKEANGQTTSAASEFNSLPFGYLATNTPKYLAHDIYVKTNANNGYNVSAELAQQMTSAYGNNIDPFVQDKDTPITWGTPGAWATPDGTVANTDTGWLGMSTPDATGIAGWTGDVGDWGPVPINVPNEVPIVPGNVILNSTTPDLGTVATRISYAIEVNVYQPADSYTGTLVYNCVPIY